MKKAWATKVVPGVLRFVSMRFLIFEKGMSKKIAPGMLIFGSMLCFKIWKKDKQKNCFKNL